MQPLGDAVFVKRSRHRATYTMCACVCTCTFDSPALNNFSPFLTQNQIQPSSSKYTRGSHLTGVHTWSKPQLWFAAMQNHKHDDFFDTDPGTKAHPVRETGNVVLLPHC